MKHVSQRPRPARPTVRYLRDTADERPGPGTATRAGTTRQPIPGRASGGTGDGAGPRSDQALHGDFGKESRARALSATPTRSSTTGLLQEDGQLVGGRGPARLDLLLSSLDEDRGGRVHRRGRRTRAPSPVLGRTPGHDRFGRRRRCAGRVTRRVVADDGRGTIRQGGAGVLADAPLPPTLPIEPVLFGSHTRSHRGCAQNSDGRVPKPSPTSGATVRTNFR